MAKLIIFDVYGTIIKTDVADGIARPGLKELQEFYKDSLNVTCSDGEKKKIEYGLKLAGIYDYFDGHYSDDNLIISDRILKDLGRICKECGVKNSEAVFIGDNFVGRDEDSAKEFGIRFIKVPQFRHQLPPSSERIYHENYVKYDDPNNPFSFESLIGKL
jgi:phosphoglycolate phosphatase-like HAD superfamily hydrolase